MVMDASYDVSAEIHWVVREGAALMRQLDVDPARRAAFYRRKEVLNRTLAMRHPEDSEERQLGLQDATIAEELAVHYEDLARGAAITAAG